MLYWFKCIDDDQEATQVPEHVGYLKMTLIMYYLSNNSLQASFLSLQAENLFSHIQTERESCCTSRSACLMELVTTEPNVNSSQEIDIVAADSYLESSGRGDNLIKMYPDSSLMDSSRDT